MHNDNEVTVTSSEHSTTSLPGGRSKKPPGMFVRGVQKAYGFFGFKRGYNFFLWIIFGGAMLGFSLARLPYLNIAGSAPTSFANSANPTEWHWYGVGHYRIGITLHLGTVLPAGILMFLQFIPAIRYKFLMFHRINGYTITTLTILSNIGALMIARRAFGGGLEIQAGVGILVIATTVGLAMAIYNIKRLQIEEHRKWMLRTMFYMGTIITLRFILVISATIIGGLKNYYATMSCEEIEFVHTHNSRNITGSLARYGMKYPACVSGNPDATTDGRVAVHAAFGNDARGGEEVAAAFQLSFGMAMWVAFFLHTVGVEIYIALTPKENERLRKISYEKQMERGFANPGSAGLTVDRWGDSDPWVPPKQETAQVKSS